VLNLTQNFLTCMILISGIDIGYRLKMNLSILRELISKMVHIKRQNFGLNRQSYTEFLSVASSSTQLVLNLLPS